MDYTGLRDTYKIRLTTTLRNRLIARRVKLGLQQKDIAAKIDMHWTGVSNIERGKCKKAHIITIKRLAGALGLDVNKLIGKTQRDMVPANTARKTAAKKNAKNNELPKPLVRTKEAAPGTGPRVKVSIEVTSPCRETALEALSRAEDWVGMLTTGSLTSDTTLGEITVTVEEL